MGSRVPVLICGGGPVGLALAALVLVRPDGHVAWRGDVCPDDALNLIDRARGALGR